MGERETEDLKAPCSIHGRSKNLLFHFGVQSSLLSFWRRCIFCVRSWLWASQFNLLFHLLTILLCNNDNSSFGGGEVDATITTIPTYYILPTAYCIGTSNTKTIHKRKEDCHPNVKWVNAGWKNLYAMCLLWIRLMINEVSNEVWRRLSAEQQQEEKVDQQHQHLLQDSLYLHTGSFCKSWRVFLYDVSLGTLSPKDKTRTMQFIPSVQPNTQCGCQCQPTHIHGPFDCNRMFPGVCLYRALASEQSSCMNTEYIFVGSILYYTVYQSFTW